MIQAKDLLEEADRDLERRIMTYLLRHQRSGFRRLQVEAYRGVVTMRGVLRSFYEKQLCMRFCQHVAGVMRVIDEVEVVAPEPVALADSY